MYDEANNEKLRLEQKQRAARKAADRGDPIKPLWFDVRSEVSRSYPRLSRCSEWCRQGARMDLFGKNRAGVEDADLAGTARQLTVAMPASLCGLKCLIRSDA